MKGIIIVDIPVSDPVEIDEYGMIADIKIRPMTLTKREDLTFELKNVDIRPMPQKIYAFEEWMGIKRQFRGQYVSKELENQVLGYNRCIDEILGEEE